MEKSTTRAEIWFCSRGFNTWLNFDLEIFLPFDILKVWSFVYPVIKFQRDTRLFSACTIREKEWRSLLASYMNGLTVLSID